MSLIVLQYEIADQYPVASDFSGDLLAGTLVGLDTNGNVAIASGSVNPIGLAGDTISSTTGGTAYSVDLVVSHGGRTVYTQNRVSDMFDETKASGYMTVYVGNGKFATDQFVESGTGSTFAPGDYLYTNATGKWSNSTVVNSRKVGYVVKVPTKYPSGVPGTDVSGSMALAGSTVLGEYLTVVLSI